MFNIFTINCASFPQYTIFVIVFFFEPINKAYYYPKMCFRRNIQSNCDVRNDISFLNHFLLQDGNLEDIDVFTHETWLKYSYVNENFSFNDTLLFTYSKETYIWLSPLLSTDPVNDLLCFLVAYKTCYQSSSSANILRNTANLLFYIYIYKKISLSYN